MSLFSMCVMANGYEAFKIIVVQLLDVNCVAFVTDNCVFSTERDKCWHLSAKTNS